MKFHAYICYGLVLAVLTTVYVTPVAFGLSGEDSFSSERSDQVWANELKGFVESMGATKLEKGTYDEVPATTVEISDVLTCLDSKVTFIIHFLSTGRYITQFRLEGKQAGESVRMVAKQLFDSEIGSKKELEAGRILRTQAYLSRIVPLVEEDSKSRRIADRQKSKIKRLCDDPALVNEFLRRIKPREGSEESADASVES